MSDGSQTQAAGVGGSVRRLLDALVAILNNRLELFSIELQEEKYRLIEILLWTVVLAFLGMMTAIMITFAVIILVWETQARNFVVGGFCLLYALSAWGAFLGLKNRLTQRPKPFEATLNEIRKDRS